MGLPGGGELRAINSFSVIRLMYSCGSSSARIYYGGGAFFSMEYNSHVCSRCIAGLQCPEELVY